MTSIQSYGWIRFKGLQINGARVGVYPHERQPRPIVVDLGVWGPVAAPAATDRLEDSIDYDALAALVAETAGRRHYNLLETLCETVAAAILESFDVDRVQIEIHKPEVRAGMTASVAIERGRQ